MPASPRIAWCTPCNRDIDPRVYQSHLGVISFTASEHVARIEHIIIPRGMIVDRSRNLCVREALRFGCDYLFWVDEDVCIPGNAIQALLEDDRPIVSGLYFLRSPPYSPCMYALTSESLTRGRFAHIPTYKEGLVEVGLVGMGCCLVHAEVYRKIGDPWYQITGAGRTEDVWFCLRALQCGYKIYVDTRVKCWHLGERVPIGEPDFFLARQSARPVERDDGTVNVIMTDY